MIPVSHFNAFSSILNELKADSNCRTGLEYRQIFCQRSILSIVQELGVLSMWPIFLRDFPFCQGSMNIFVARIRSIKLKKIGCYYRKLACFQLIQLLLGRININDADEKKHKEAELLNNIAVTAIFLLTLVNIFITAVGISEGSESHKSSNVNSTAKN